MSRSALSISYSALACATLLVTISAVSGSSVRTVSAWNLLDVTGAYQAAYVFRFSITVTLHVGIVVRNALRPLDAKSIQSCGLVVHDWLLPYTLVLYCTVLASVHVSCHSVPSGKLGEYCHFVTLTLTGFRYVCLGMLCLLLLADLFLESERRATKILHW